MLNNSMPNNSLQCFKAQLKRSHTHCARLKHFHKRHRLSLPQQDDDVWLAEFNGQLIGVARLVPFDQAWWLRGLFILPEYRQQGYAHQLIRTLRSDTDAVIYAFARPALHAFYQRLGFEAIPQMEITEALQNRLKTYQKSQPTLNVYRCEQ